MHILRSSELKSSFTVLQKKNIKSLIERVKEINPLVACLLILKKFLDKESNYI